MKTDTEVGVLSMFEWECWEASGFPRPTTGLDLDDLELNSPLWQMRHPARMVNHDNRCVVPSLTGHAARSVNEVEVSEEWNELGMEFFYASIGRSCPDHDQWNAALHRAKELHEKETYRDDPEPMAGEEFERGMDEQPAFDQGLGR